MKQYREMYEEIRNCEDEAKAFKMFLILLGDEYDEGYADAKTMLRTRYNLQI